MYPDIRQIFSDTIAQGGDRLQAFDNMVELYHRCTNNPGMIDHWDEFTAETVENF